VENQVSFEDIKELFRETDRKMAESRAETERLMAQSRAETDRVLRDVTHQLGRLGNRLGEFAEGVVRPGLVRLFRQWGLDVHETIRGLESSRRGESAEVDLMVVNEDVAVAVEVKSKLTVERVDEHLERLGKFRRLFSRFEGICVLGAVAGMVISDGVAEYAGKKGLFVIGQKGEDAVLLNTEGFEPRAW
jgi:hypothetical protein